MIDEKILDQVIPVPDLTELKDQRIQELSDAGFAIKTSIPAASSTRSS